MSSPTSRLDILRQEIDSIDTALHDLIVRRATVVEDIRKTKKAGGPALRPGREATILRRLAAKHQGPYPLSAVIGIWREMMGGFTHMQQPFSCAVHAPAGDDRIVRLARDHYGSLTPVSALPSATACVRAVAEETADVAVLPVPADGEAESWWTMLMADDAKTPRVVTRLPFLGGADGDEALVIAPWQRDFSDSEASLLAIRLSERTSRGRIVGAVAAAGFAEPVSLATMETDPENCFHAIEVAGAVATGDAAMAALGAQFGESLIEAYVIGGYARPIAPHETTGRK
jgi:chorismate mutase